VVQAGFVLYVTIEASVIVNICMVLALTLLSIFNVQSCAFILFKLAPPVVQVKLILPNNHVIVQYNNVFVAHEQETVNVPLSYIHISCMLSVAAAFVQDKFALQKFDILNLVRV
jgi:hypothetical protein